MGERKRLQRERGKGERESLGWVGQKLGARGQVKGGAWQSARGAKQAFTSRQRKTFFTQERKEKCRLDLVESVY